MSPGVNYQTFSPSKKLLAHGVWQKICHSISSIKSKAKITGQNLKNLCANCQTLSAKKRRWILHTKNSRSNVDEIDPRRKSCKRNSVLLLPILRECAVSIFKTKLVFFLKTKLRLKGLPHELKFESWSIYFITLLWACLMTPYSYPIRIWVSNMQPAKCGWAARAHLRNLITNSDEIYFNMRVF